MPLLITDSAGKPVFVSPALKRGDAQRTLSSVAAENKALGIAEIGKRKVLIREYLLSGEKHRIFLDFDRLSVCFGEDAGSIVGYALDGMLDGGSAEREIPISSLAYIFAETHAPLLRDGGANLHMRGMAIGGSVTAPLGALLVCLSLMARIFSKKGETVSLRAVRTGGRVEFFADSTGGEAPESDFYKAMLSELSVKFGFEIKMDLGGDKHGIMLRLHSLDVADYGFKAVDDIKLRKMCEVMAEIFLGDLSKI